MDCTAILRRRAANIHPKSQSPFTLRPVLCGASEPQASASRRPFLVRSGERIPGFREGWGVSRFSADHFA